MRELEASEYVVAGAGPAGLTIARLLALRGRRVVVLGAARREAYRLELLAPAAHGTVSALGLEELLRDTAIARPCLGIRRPQARPEDVGDFFRHPGREGYVVERDRFDRCLRAAALAAGAVILPLRVTGLTAGAALNVRSETGASGILPLNGILVDATGRTAAIARRKGARIAFRDRVVAELIADVPAHRAAREFPDMPSWLIYQANANGWSYCIEGPRKHLQTWRVARAQWRSNHAIDCVDASACLLSKAAGARWIAVGDAASSFNPISSQGLLNALSSALAAAGLLLSDKGLSYETAHDWSAAVAATFLHSEKGRAALVS